MKSKLQSLFVCKTNQTYLQFIRYLGVGALAAAVNIGLLAFFKEVLSLDYLLANVFGFMGGLTINYLLSRVLVFSADGVQDKTFEFTFYALIGVLGLALDTILLWVGTQLIVHYWGETPFLGIKAYLFAKIISTGLVFIWNFGARKVLYTSRRLNAFRLPAFSAGLWLLLPVLVLVHTVAGGVFVSGNNWPNASVMKFVNNWLDEGALNLQLALYEYPASIEFNSFVEREAYVSYPPGSTILPWLFAKAVGMTEMTLEGSRQYSSFMLLLEVLLVGVIFYFILLHYLKVRRQYWLVASSAALALCWMFLPVSIFQLRNACFADQSVTAFALAFILLEITRDYFTGRYPLLKYPWLLLLFFVGVCGVLVDYYILFVLFIAWLVRAISLVRKGLSREIIGKILRISVPYIAAVVVGLSLFALWLSLVPGGGFQCLVEKMQQRTALLENGRFMLLRVGGHFLTSYTFAGVLVMAFSFLLLGFYLKKMRVPGLRHSGDLRALFKFVPLIYVAPCFQVLVLQEHSGVHEVSVLKFAFPFVFSILLLNLFLSDYLVKRIPSLAAWGRIPVLCAGLIANSFFCILVINGLCIHNGFYAKRRLESVNYELARAIRQHSRFEDVYFSHTYSIAGNPPMLLSISKKPVYKIEDIGGISQRFPRLKREARILLVVQKDDSQKSPGELLAEKAALKEASECFSSDNFAVYHYTGKW